MFGLEVPDSAFFRLQEDMIQRLAQMLIDEQQAAVALSQVNKLAQAFLTNPFIKFQVS